MLKPEDIFGRLKFLREILGLTQAEIAAEYGTKQQYWASYETGTKVPHSFLQTVAAKAPVSTDWLLTGNVNKVLAGKLQQERERKKLKAEDVAQKLGTTKDFIYAAEGGQIGLSDNFITEIAALYGVNKYHLLDNTLKFVPAVKSTGDDTLDREVAENMHVPSDIKEIEKLLLNDPDAVPLVKQLLIGRAAARKLMKP